MKAKTGAERAARELAFRTCFGYWESGFTSGQGLAIMKRGKEKEK